MEKISAKPKAKIRTGTLTPANWDPGIMIHVIKRIMRMENTNSPRLKTIKLNLETRISRFLTEYLSCMVCSCHEFLSNLHRPESV